MAIGLRLSQTKMVEMRAYDDILVLQNRIAAFDDSNDIFGVARVAVNREVDVELLALI